MKEEYVLLKPIISFLYHALLFVCVCVLLQFSSFSLKKKAAGGVAVDVFVAELFIYENKAI